MTRAEAIYRLKNTAWLGSDADRVATENAVQMAIEALKAQDKIVHCKDCKWGDADCTPDGNEIYWVCKNWDGGTDADGFCYEGER